MREKGGEAMTWEFVGELAALIAALLVWCALVDAVAALVRTIGRER